MWTAVVIAVLTVTAIALVAGLLLSYASSRLPANTGRLVEQVNDLLPQTQCAQCGYAGCRPYAAAIVGEGEAINLCPPGGAETAQRLADLLGREATAPVAAAINPGSVAIIEESRCIGCVHCREVCPVDAIVGAQQLMHTIIASECTGCELCVPRCPVDCIRMEAAA